MLGVGRILNAKCSSPVDSVVNGLQRRQWSLHDLLHSLHNSLQTFAVPHSSGSIPHAHQEVMEDLSRRAKLPQYPKEVQPLLSLLDQLGGITVSVQVRSLLMWTPRYLKLLTLSFSSSFTINCATTHKEI